MDGNSDLTVERRLVQEVTAVLLTESIRAQPDEIERGIGLTVNAQQIHPAIGTEIPTRVLQAKERESPVEASRNT